MKKMKIDKIILATISTILLAAGILWFHSTDSFEKKPIKVGVLHSLTGTMSISERPVADATLMAIEELNEKGGVLGRKVVPVVVDGQSDWPTFAREAERLITEEKVSVVFGCWTSACRRQVKPIFEKYKHLLFYPVQYEGLENSPNIVYTGAAPSQQIIPAVNWCFTHIGKRFFLVASDYIFPHSANAIIRDLSRIIGAEIVGEEYLPVGSGDVEGIVRKIKESQPDVILNTINGDSNIAFFKELRKAGITPEIIPTMSFSIGESELRMIKELDMLGDYAAWNYFQSIDSLENQRFVEKFRKKFGQNRVLSDPMEAAYFGVHLWAQAVADAGTSNPKETRKTIKNQTFNAPEGMIYIEPQNNHTWKTVRIGKIRNDGQFEIVWKSGHVVEPTPYPISRTRAEWDLFLQNQFETWGGKWENAAQ